MEGGHFYRAMWRWHFYAGLIVLPVLALMAVTGALYLYKPEIERIVYRDRIVVQPGGALLAPSRLVAAVEKASGGRVSQIQRPAASDESWRLTVGRTAWFVDPYDGRILGSMAGGGVMKTIKDLHSLAITGPIGNRLVEVVAGWAILLCVTGLYLRWPRAGNRALALRGRPGGRLFWRDLHGTVGFLAAGVILFLAVTGMPWTEVWGGGLRGVITAQGLGRPSAAVVPWSAPVKEVLPWALREGGAVRGGAGGVDVDEIMRIADRRGLTGGVTIGVPASPGSPWLVSALAVRAEDSHVLTIDAGSGAVAQDVDWRMFGGGAKAVEWGVATHQGLEYGEPNRLLMLAGCLCLLLLCVTGPVLWWKRRPEGRLGEPPAAAQGAKRIVAGLMLGLGVLFPLTGLSMVAALLGEWAAGRLRRA
ncbi:PepSY-associated TM helix domain-containing protein [Sphingobium chungbukense]|uniref:Peptidase n=1 Tax=Sphingobium chungbukense TaxID=56193 RepID=A0A0M3AQ45_9SPHN|nr:PepSY domain-containing protein [Sphingobium chungbukense]KKW92312.1 peptidase [Sphingobium chungbukense]